MLFVRRGFGDEKSQLNELNRRLDQYLSRVRQLETENQHLVEEIHRLRLERGAEWTQVYHSEVCELRKRVEELTIEKSEAELQRDNLLQDLQVLQELWEQVRSMRLKIDQQLALYKQDLQQAQNNQAALEKLYIQLQQECQMLEGSHEEEMMAIRDQAVRMPLQITMQEVLRPQLSLTDIQSFSLELSESWKDAFVYYQKKIEEIESILRLSEEERHGAEEEATIYRLQVEKLHKEHDELLAIKKMLEDELLRMKAKYKLEVEEYQFIIGELETEKKTITLNITERLKDYHELMQVKTGLSLEVAAYRALLEAESKKGSVIITEHTVRDRPAGYVTSTLEETTRFSNRGQNKFDYLIPKTKDEIRWKAQTTDSGRFYNRTVPQTQISPRYTNLGNTSSSHSSRIYENTPQERCGRWDTSLSTRYDSSNKSEASPSVLYHTVQPKSVSTYASTQSSISSKTSQKEQMKDQKPVARPRTHSRETRRGQVDIKVENNQQGSDSQKAFATEVVEERKSDSQYVREAKHVMKGNVKMTENENRNKYDETVSVTETVQKDTIQEPKTQELPVKKERKKRDQAKKRKEEEENVVTGDTEVTGGLTMEVHKTTQVKRTTVLDDKLNDKPVVYEVPIKIERKQEEQKTRHFSPTYVSQDTTLEKNIEDYGITNQTHREKNIFVDDYPKQLGQSSVLEKNKTDIFLEENNRGSRLIGTFVLGEKSEDKKVVMEIPIQREENRKETSLYKEYADDSVKSKISENENRRKEEEILDRNKRNNVRLDFKTNDFGETEESLRTSSETIEKKSFVTDILKQLGHPSDLDDANVTYVEQKQKCSDGSVRTEIFVESKVEDELDLFDEPDLTDLWNTASSSSSQKKEASNIPVEEIQSRKIKKTILEDITGAEAEEWIGNVIHTGLKGSPGKSVNVEILEESIGTFAYEKGEDSTPFHVEEVEDNYTKEESVITEEMSAPVRTGQGQENIQANKRPAQVEEIIEGEHFDEEIDYFVSIPDDIPYVQEEEEDTIRGQIHTEEESHLTYSWQDEFLQGSQGRKSLSEMLKQATATEPTSVDYKITTDYTDTSDKEKQKETSHVETVTIEKRKTYESSVDRDDEVQTQPQKEREHVETLSKAAFYGSSVDSSGRADINKEGQLHVKTIGIERAETYGSSVDSSDTFDINEQAQLHVKTTGTEKADTYRSLMDISERFYTEEHEGRPHVETVVIENKIKASPEIQSSLITLLSRDITDPQLKLKGALDCLQGSLPEELVAELSTLVGEEQTQASSLAVDIKKLGQPDESGTVTIVAEINVSKTLDTDDIDDLELNKYIESEERTIHKYQSISSKDERSGLQKERTEFENKTNKSEDSYNSVTVGFKDREEDYTSKECFVKSPTTTGVHLSPTQDISFGQISTDVSRYIKHIELDTQMFSDDSASVQSSAASLSPTETNRSEHHIKLSPKEPFFNKQIIFEGPISETLKLDIVKNMDGTSEQNRSIKHIKISPTESVSTEQIIFQGPLYKTVGMGAPEELSFQEKHVGNVNEATTRLVFEKAKAGSQEETSSCSSEFSSGPSSTVSHFKVNTGGSFSNQLMFDGSIPITFDIGKTDILKTDHSKDDSKPVEHSSNAQKIHVAKQVKYQGFVSEQHTMGDSDGNGRPNINTSVHHIKLSPGKEQIVFEGPISANFHISGEDKMYTEDTHRPIRHIRLGSPEADIMEQVSFEGPTTESFESSDFFVSSPSGDSTESERSIKHIKLGPKEKTFTFQMDITKIATKNSEEKETDNSGLVVTSHKFEGQPEFSQSGAELFDEPEVSESGYGEEEIAGVSQLAYEILPQSRSITEVSDLEKTFQIQRIVHQSDMVSDEKRVAIVYLDEEDEDEDEADQDYLRRSF